MCYWQQLVSEFREITNFNSCLKSSKTNSQGNIMLHTFNNKIWTEKIIIIDTHVDSRIIQLTDGGTSHITTNH